MKHVPLPTPRGRFAPSPTSGLHLGNVRTALAVWLSVRSHGGTLVLRVEDLDAPRVVPWGESGAIEDLAWMGLDWDEGPDVGGPFGPYRQSERSLQYDEALRSLHESGRIFPCRRSRKDLKDLASAPHAGSISPYPSELRPSELPPDWYERLSVDRDAAIRFAVDQSPVAFHDLGLGSVEEDVARTVGDFVLYRRDGVYAYQLAVVVDDVAMGITEVVRGRDLLDSTARQIQLMDALGAPPPRFGHVPLVLNTRGEKLSKRDAALTVSAVREAGVRAEQLCGYLAYSLGLSSKPRSAMPIELLSHFSWSRMTRTDWRLPADVIEELLRVT